MDANKFGSFIQALRKEQGLTQAELAKLLGVTDKAVSRWERCVGFPDISLLEPLAEALGVTVAELMRSQRMEQQIPAETVDKIVIQTLDLAEEQQRNQWRSRALTFGVLPVLILVDVFLTFVIDRYVQSSDWTRVLGIGVVSWCVLFAVFGIWYIASCRYAAPTKRRKPAKFWITTSLTTLGLTVVGIFRCIPGDKPKWFSLLTMIALALTLASPFYLYHLMTDEISDWNRWNGGRDF